MERISKTLQKLPKTENMTTLSQEQELKPLSNKEIYSYSQLPMMFWEKTFDNFDNNFNPLNKIAYIKSKEFTKEYIAGKLGQQTSNSILLYSKNCGIGKTHLTASIVNKIIKTKGRFECWFITESGLLSEIRKTFKQEKPQITEEQIINRACKTPLLIIDDIGKYRPADNSFLQRVMFDVIDYRYNNCKSLVMTSNLDPSELEEHWGSPIFDRIAQMTRGKFIELTGRSYRQR